MHRQDRGWRDFIVNTEYVRKEEEEEEEEKEEERRKEEGAGGVQEKQEPHTKDVGKHSTGRFRRHFPKSTATPLWGARMCENTYEMQQECIEKTEVGEISL